MFLFSEGETIHGKCGVFFVYCFHEFVFLLWFRGVENKVKCSRCTVALRQRENEIDDEVNRRWASMNDKNSAKEIGRIRLAMSKLL